MSHLKNKSKDLGWDGERPKCDPFHSLGPTPQPDDSLLQAGHTLWKSSLVCPVQGLSGLMVELGGW